MRTALSLRTGPRTCLRPTPEPHCMSTWSTAEPIRASTTSLRCRSTTCLTSRGGDGIGRQPSGRNEPSSCGLDFSLSRPNQGELFEDGCDQLAVVAEGEGATLALEPSNGQEPLVVIAADLKLDNLGAMP